jgi:CBS domain-containing protein
VADIMNPKIYSVREDATVPEIASMMLKGHIHRLLVTRRLAFLMHPQTPSRIG